MALEKPLLCDTAFGPPQDHQTNNPWPPAQYGADFEERNTTALEKPMVHDPAVGGPLQDNQPNSYPWPPAQFAAQQTATDAAAPQNQTVYYLPLQANTVQNPVQHVSVS